MKRRSFGLLAGTSLAAASMRKAVAQTAPDPTLLTTTLTPLGGERSGNADGSIPAWTGGWIVENSTNYETPAFPDEQKLFTIDASNLSQYGDMIAPGIQLLMKQSGLSANVYPTHRTAAAPQYVYDNTAKNVTRALLNPKGGRLGFTGAYGGVPFPIINTTDPLVGGAQLIWNHLTAYAGFCEAAFDPDYVVINGVPILSAGVFARFRSPYYDPDGSPETFNGYLTYAHTHFRAPASVNGQEDLFWHTSNVDIVPDISWTLLNGQGRVRKAPDEQYDTPVSFFNALCNLDETSGFYGNPSQYDWTCLGKQEMYIPYNCNRLLFSKPSKFLLPKHPDPAVLRWEKHRVWVVEANLHPGIHNVLAKRRFYLDEDTWNITAGEAYDAAGNMVRAYLQYLSAIPALPCTSPTGFSVFDLQTGDYVFSGVCDTPYSSPLRYDVIPMSEFDPQVMAATSSF